MNPIHLEPAFLLHSRAYRNTSLIVDLFTLHHGWISAVAKGIKSPKSPLRNNLQAFQPLLVSWCGRGEMVTLTQVEIDTPFSVIHNEQLAWGFYLNELMYRLLEKHDPQPQLFSHYQNLLLELSQATATEKHLRLFERDLLAILGYGLQLTIEINTSHAIHPETDYYYSYDHGPSRRAAEITNIQHCYPGRSLLALDEGTFEDPIVLKDAKRLLRGAIQNLLGNKPLRSRELIRA
ncbi:MAG: DNA repair protein RecO [Gammaproteobacteria bacterium]|nr:DNA repair protein RecO [Gammaproteobacteria bacterium]